jgi:ERCC4-related helicase
MLQGMDLTDINIIMQYHAMCNLCMLWQRFGRGARRAGREAVEILLVDKKHTEEGQETVSGKKNTPKNDESTPLTQLNKRKAPPKSNSKVKQCVLDEITPSINGSNMAKGHEIVGVKDSEMIDGTGKDEGGVYM